MKILMLNYEFPPLGGDSGQASLCLLREYVKIPEIEIDFVCASADEKYHMLKMGENVTIHRIPIGKNADNLGYQSDKELRTFTWRVYWFSRALAKKNAYALTHSFFAVPCGFIAYLLKRKFKIPYVITLRGADVPGYSQRFAKLHKQIASRFKKIMDNASFVTSCNQNLKNLILSADSLREISVIYDGVDLQKFFPNYSMRNPDNFTVVCVSRITPQKGVRVLIQAMKILYGRYGQLRLIIVGDGNEKKSLEDLSRGLGISDRVSFVGQIAPEKIVEFYQQADVFVSPSFNEDIDRVIPEALACGLPAIVTNTFASREILSENVNVLFAKAKDADDLAEKIERLLLDHGLCQLLEKNARARAEQMGWETIAKNYMDLYLKTRNIANIRQ